MQANIVVVIILLAFITAFIWLLKQLWNSWDRSRWKVDVRDLTSNELDDELPTYQSGVFITRAADRREILIKPFRRGDDIAMLEGLTAAKDYKRSLKQLSR